MAVVPLWVWPVGIALAALASGAILYALARPGGRWGRALRGRFVMGVPWGTLTVATLVALFYLFAQGGLTNWRTPTVIPFRAWSYFYPLGILSGGFAHSGPGHLIGNLVGTLTFGSLAEYAWGHFPTERGSQSFRSLREHPGARIAAFVGLTLAAGSFMGAFSLGPVIGFSGVVFAFAGFAIVRHPIASVGLLLGSDLIGLVYSALRSPTVTTSPGPSFSTPFWAQIAIQGHAIGFFLGVLAAAVLVGRRGDRASPGLVWFAALVYATDRGLWAVYTFEGGGRFTLFRAGGVALLFIIAALVASGAAASARDLLGSIDLSRREAALGLLASVLVALSLVAVPYNTLAIASGGPGLENATGVEQRDYTVYYAENVPDRFVTAFDVPGVETSDVTVSGAIVVSEQRNIWWQEVSKSRLAFAGTSRVRVGGLTWRRTVVINRTGWSVVGAGTTYRVRMKPKGGSYRLAYRGSPATAAPTIDGRNVTVEPRSRRPRDPNGFRLNVTAGNRTLGTAPVPANSSAVQVGGLTLRREGRNLYAARNGTRVRVARRTAHRGR